MSEIRLGSYGIEHDPMCWILRRYVRRRTGPKAGQEIASEITYHTDLHSVAKRLTHWEAGRSVVESEAQALDAVAGVALSRLESLFPGVLEGGEGG